MSIDRVPGYTITSRYEQLLKLGPKKLEIHMQSIRGIRSERVTAATYEEDVLTALRIEFGKESVDEWKRKVLNDGA